MRTYNTQQNNYLMAKVNYQTSLKQLRELQILNGVDEMYETDFDKAFDLDESLSEQVRNQEAYDLMSKTEEQLVEWGFAQAELQELYKKNLKDLEFLRQQTKECIVTREKVAELIMKLDTTKEAIHN